MSEAMSVDSTVAAPPPPPPPPAAVAAPPPPPQQIEPQQPVKVDREIMEILSKTQNKCFAEMGYYPTLQRDFQELQKNYEILRTDNQKLYTDNRTLAQFIQQQDQRIRLLLAPVDMQTRTLAELHERVRSVTAERDEIAGRLHAALNEIVILRQELSRHVPGAVMVSAQERMPSRPQQLMPQQRAVTMPVIHNKEAEHPPNLIPYTRPPPPQQQHPRSIQPLPARPSQPILSPLDTSAPPPTISHHRRASAPLPQPGNPHSAAPASASASPINNFTGLSLASPATPGSGRPSTGSAPASTAPPSASAPWPTTHAAPRKISMVPAQPQRVSSSSLAGAVIDLTAEESQAQEVARKRRKTDHTPDMAGPSSRPPSAHQAQSASSALAGALANGQISAPHSRPASASAPTSAPAPAPAAVDAPVSASVVPSAPVPAPASHHPPSITSPAAPLSRPHEAGLPTRDPPPPLSEDSPMEEQTTLEEDCLEANFDEDDEDENKLWCRMCRSRFAGGHTTEPPVPFVGAPPQELIAHCETVHPRGWQILKEKVAEQRAADEPV